MDKGFCELNISQLVKADWNYKEDNRELAEKLANNIKRNGQIENIIVRELDTGFFEVVNGNHRLDVMAEIGLDNVYCYNLGEISLANAQRIAIETNETKFRSSVDKLETILLEINEEFDLEDMIATMPFDKAYIESLINRSEADISSFFEETPEEESKPKELICPHCGKNVYEEE